MKIGIVLEGGGMRGIYSTGVLDAFLQEKFMADEVVGVSAGASIGISYVSMQYERGLRTTVNYAGQEDYISLHNFIKTKSLFGMDYIFGKIPEELDPFNYETFAKNPCKFYAGATEVHTGKTIYFGKEEIVPPCTVLRASCSLPVFSPVVPYKGGEYLDGGLLAPIPIQKALADGCDKLIIVLTRERGYRKEPQIGRPVYAQKYRHYPALVHIMDTRHKVYNSMLQTIQRMEHMGSAIIAAPDEPLPLDRFGTNHEQLLAAYNIGLEKGKEALQRAQKTWGLTLPLWPAGFPDASSVPLKK
ncbi:MAG: patatin family protein [Oscillospiraceae bacterium]|jgi:predicted patatin/cPLA2 family phospholipase|nr:patatin family protein [Oscillospiraceae bacterium]